MKTKLLILLILLWINTYGQKLPITGLCWGDVFTATGTTCSPDAWAAANSSYFDAYYAVSGDCLDDWRNYGPSIYPPTVVTSNLNSPSSTTCSTGGTVTDDGGASVTTRGMCWNTSGSPTISDSHTASGSGTGSFSVTITGLSPSTTYYNRAYATNSAGTSYGSQLSFTTTSSATTPTVTTASITSITSTTATGGGNVTADGGASVTARGICWNTSTNPTTSNSHTSNGTGTGSYSSSLTSLTASTAYYVRAYATNSVGTSYGSNVSFVTEDCTRPTGLTNYSLNGWVSYNSGTTWVDLSQGTGASFCSGLTGVSGWNTSTTAQASSLTIGTTVYSGTGTDCTLFNSGWWMIWSFSGATKPNIYHVVSGVITEIYNCP